MKLQSTKTNNHGVPDGSGVVGKHLDIELEPELICIIDALARAAAEREHANEIARKKQHA